MNHQRRRFLSAFAAAMLSGCKYAPIDPGDLCQPDTGSSGKLLIDVHAHVFNGSDLQIADFISHLRDFFTDRTWGKVLQEMAGPLQKAAWALAPKGPRELEVLSSVSCDDRLNPRLEEMRKESFQIAQKVLKDAVEAYATTQGADLKNSKFSFGAKITLAPFLEMSYEQYERERKARVLEREQVRILQQTAWSLLDFVVQHFQYRYANVLEYFSTYKEASGELTDLLVTSFLDFDYWISGGRSTPTKIPEQIEVMSRISVLTRGRVHSFVPFCPLRELVTSQGGDEGDSMKWVRNAVEQKGFIGVKMYPPMGFAPYGNATAQAKNPNIWKKGWLPPIAKTPDFGKNLDGMLDRLYDWCEKNDVPVMAHTSPVNSMDPDFDCLGEAKYWAMALKKHPALRANFGHIGGNKNEDAPLADGFMKLFSAYKNAYADDSYFFDIVDHGEHLRRALEKLFSPYPDVPQRMMYGTDYQMIVSEDKWPRYQSDSRAMMKRIGADLGWPTLEDDFFGSNAARYLGLKKRSDGKRGNRERLQTFYNGQFRPAWMDKVDRLPD